VRARISLVALSAALSLTRLIAAQPGFPEPSGPFDVGRIEIDVTDASRDEAFTDDPADKRRLLVTVYYPATVAAGTEHALYGTPELAAAFPFFDQERRAWRTSSYAGVPVANERFPVLLFSPGLGSPTLFYSSLLSEIASHGYVVAALWHPYSTQVVAFPDGTVLSGNPAGGLSPAPPDEQEARIEKVVLVWVADQRFVLDQLTAWNQQHDLLRGHLDLARIGAFGHSLGGATAVQAAHEDNRIDAAINMDGAMFGTVMTDARGSRAPFLFVAAEVPAPTDADLQRIGMTREQAEARMKSILDARASLIARSRDARSQTLERGLHNTFHTDLLFFTAALPQEQRVGIVGDVDPASAFADISGWIAEFMTTNVRDAK
jgi:dienelactone hydrolase